MMTNDEFRAWSLKQLEASMRRNMPAARIARLLKADARESKKAFARARRALASREASSRRKFNQDLTDIERLASARLAASDRELEEKRWQLIIDFQ